MEVRDIITITIFIQLVIVSFMCVRNAQRNLDLLKLIEELNELHKQKEEIIIQMIQNKR